MSPRLQTIAGVIVYGLTLVALVVLLVVGRPVDSVMLLAGPVVAALLVTGQITDRLNPIHDAVSKIDEQTNGVLDQRIKTATDEEAWVRIAGGEQTDIAAARARDLDRAEKAIGGEVTAYWTARRALDDARDQLDDALARAERDGVTAYRLAQASGLTQRAVRMAIDRSRGR